MKRRYCFHLALAGMVLLTACNKRSTPAQDKVHEEQESLNRKVAAKEESYKKKSLAELISEMESVAQKGKEPFNSLAFREVLRRREGAEQIFQSIQSREQKEYFKLMALRQISPELFKRLGCEISCPVLTAALQKSVVFNAWGLPHLYWESSAKAIIECGPVAIPFLKPLLQDKRPAPVWGSEEALESEKYHYRVCDYAFALISEINNQKWTPSVRVEERDKAIAELPQ